MINDLGMRYFKEHIVHVPGFTDAFIVVNLYCIKARNY